MINPTGGRVRIDSLGDGRYGKSRGRRMHKGVDYECVPGQDVKMPVSGIITRIKRPYANSDLNGIEIKTPVMQVTIFYMEVYKDLIGKKVFSGYVIGKAQDVSKRYDGMTPHVHLQIDSIDPSIFIEDFNV